MMDKNKRNIKDKVNVKIEPTEIEIAVNTAMHRQGQMLEKRLYKGLANQNIKILEAVQEVKTLLEELKENENEY